MTQRYQAAADETVNRVVRIARATLGVFANDLLVANFGDGTIAAFDLAPEISRAASLRKHCLQA